MERVVSFYFDAGVVPLTAVGLVRDLHTYRDPLMILSRSFARNGRSERGLIGNVEFFCNVNGPASAEVAARVHVGRLSCGASSQGESCVCAADLIVKVSRCNFHPSV